MKEELKKSRLKVLTENKRLMEIRLSELRFFSKIGVFEQERVVGGEFELKVKLRYVPAYPVTDDLNDTISYAAIYDEIKVEMDKGSLLLENMAFRIAERLQNKWPEVESGEVEITKLNAPIKGLIGKCGVRYFF